MGEQKNAYGFFVGVPETKDHMEDSSIDDKIISKCMLN
jgi:hypothetical protein